MIQRVTASYKSFARGLNRLIQQLFGYSMTFLAISHFRVYSGLAETKDRLSRLCPKERLIRSMVLSSTKKG